MPDLADFFGPESPLKAQLPGFQPRAGQAWMAEAVAEAIERGERLVVEAGTGTGKTFAYLLPALLGGRRTIVSTGTKALQDQLYHRDLPLIGTAIGRPVTTALLKGRANYLCLERLEDATAALPQSRKDLEAVRAWRHRTTSGDRAELREVAENSPLWPEVTSTADNCLGQKCPHFKDCFVVKARREAQEADLVVVNHHLLLADLAMKEAGFVEFLPGADVVILDEAHQIPDLAAQFFGLSIGTREVERLVRELRVVTQALAGPDFSERLDRLQTATRALRAAAPRRDGRHELAAVAGGLRDELEDLLAALANVEDALEPIADASLDVEKRFEVLGILRERLIAFVGDGSEGSVGENAEGLRWVEVNPRSLRLHLTPFDVSSTLGALVDAGDTAFVFTSATLAVAEDFSHFTGRMGIPEVHAVSFPSPYDLAGQGIVYLPRGLPNPSDPAHSERMLEAVLPLLDDTAGGMFCLYTSHRALNAAQRLLERDASRLRGRPLLVQGEAPRDDLLRRFREAGNAVLLGTGSFWEGVDVRGPALTIVAIDKLPFAAPSDPLMMARLEYIRRRGGNPFTEHQLPLAALALKQGAGRLLRDGRDFGVVVLCDPRIRAKPYGKLFIDCLKPMPDTDDVAEVRAFLARHERGRRVATERSA